MCVVFGFPHTWVLWRCTQNSCELRKSTREQPPSAGTRTHARTHTCTWAELAVGSWCTSPLPGCSTDVPMSLSLRSWLASHASDLELVLIIASFVLPSSVVKTFFHAATCTWLADGALAQLHGNALLLFSVLDPCGLGAATLFTGLGGAHGGKWGGPLIASRPSG